jgi:hypothetical protein
MGIKLILNKSESPLPKDPCQVWWFHLVQQFSLRSICEKGYRPKMYAKWWQNLTLPLTRWAKYLLSDSPSVEKCNYSLFDCFLVLLTKNQTRFCHRVVNINNFFNLLLTFWIWTHVGTCAEHYMIFLLLDSNSNMGCESLSRYLAHLVKGND